jgi:serine/threonine protein kinase
MEGRPAMKSEIPGRDPQVSPGNPPLVGSVDGDECPPTRTPDSWPSLASGGLFAGRYMIVKELGRGGMGVVSQARDTRLPRDVAIKVPLRFHDPNSLRRFFKEAEAAAKLDHPHICRILDLGEADGVPYIVLAFVPGQTLAEIVDHRPVAPIRASKIIRSVARTIQFAHDRGIIHRDLKPANLMIGPHRELIVMDFGLARLEDDERKTLTGQVFGTLPYMSPEQVQGQAVAMGKGCDIYTLGVIFYELLTGRLPFRGAAWELPQQIIQVVPAVPSTIISTIDPELDAIVLKAMAKEIGDRFASMNEFAQAIASYLARVGSLSNSGVAPRPQARVESPAPHHTLNPSPKRQEPAFWVQVHPEPLRDRTRPLRDRTRPQRKCRDGLIWGVVAILALIAFRLFLWFEG